MSKTPTLDKYNLHPYGGYCTCYTNPYSKCITCDAVKRGVERWNSLNKEDREKAEQEMDLAYPKTDDVGR